MVLFLSCRAWGQAPRVYSLLSADFDPLYNDTRGYLVMALGADYGPSMAVVAR